MKKTIFMSLGVVALALMPALAAHAANGMNGANGLIDSVAKGCEKELQTYCADVTPGEGRALACLYAHDDKLSGRCEYALYDAAAQLERALTALTYVANECDDDLAKYCSDIQPGQGRLLACLDKNADQVSDRCKQAIKDVAAK